MTQPQNYHNLGSPNLDQQKFEKKLRLEQEIQKIKFIKQS